MNPLAQDLDHILAHTEGLWEELRDRRIFITGGTGFIGCWLLESFLWANRKLSLGAEAVVLTRDPEALANRIRNAGAIFLGGHTPEAIGDYVGGSNHVLPTARSARFSSGLGVLDFMKRTSILKCGPDQLRALGPAAMTLGQAEGLDAHSRSVGLRLNLP